MLDSKYRIDRLIAFGGMGAVYAGTHVQLRKRVAIKILNPQLSSAAMIERFHREAITASQIGHEGIAQVTDIGTSSEGEPFLVMEYLDGESLASRLRATGRLAIEDACEIGCAILSPLDAAHRAGIVHRDLKPDNVFLVRQSRGEMVKLLDFGISRAAGLEAEFRLTTTGLVLGTPYYMSPEQARGNIDVSPAADLYAFGVMLYEMLIGHVPIQADNYNQLMYRVMTGEYARPRELRPELPEPLERLILQAMALEPINRPASATELERALLAFCRPAVREASGSLSSPVLPLNTGLMQPTPAPGSSSGARLAAQWAGPTHPGAASGAAPSVATGAPVASQRSRAPWIIGLAVLVLGGVGAGVAVSLGGDEPTAAVRPAAIDPAPVQVGGATFRKPDPAASGSAAGSASAAGSNGAAAGSAGESAGSAGSASAPPVATEPVKVTLRFAVEPRNAVILVDGVRVKASELVVDKDDAQHTLRITAPGRVAHDETIRFDESQRLSVQLPRATESPRGKDHKDPDNERIDSESPYH